MSLIITSYVLERSEKVMCCKNILMAMYFNYTLFNYTINQN